MSESHTKKQNEHTRAIQAVVHEAIEAHFDNLALDDVEVTEIKWEDEITDIERMMNQMNMVGLGISQSVNEQSETRVYFPMNMEVCEALKDAVKAMTGIHVAYTGNSIQIKDDAEFVANRLDNSERLASRLKTYLSANAAQRRIESVMTIPST